MSFQACAALGRKLLTRVCKRVSKCGVEECVQVLNVFYW